MPSTPERGRLLSCLPSLLTLVGRFDGTPHRLVGNAVIPGDVTEGVALLKATQDIRPLLGGNTPAWLVGPRATLFSVHRERAVW